MATEAPLPEAPSGKAGSDVQELGTNLFTYHKERRGFLEGGKQSISSRLVVVAQLGSTFDSMEKLAAFGESYKEAFAAMQESRKYIKISGHLVLHRQYCVHLIECVPEAFAEVLTLIDGHISSGQLRRNARVLLSTDVRDAAYSDYSVKIVSSASTQTGEYVTSESAEDVAAECINNMASLGVLLSGNRTLDLGGMEEQTALIPSEAMIQFLVRQSQIEKFTAHHTRQIETLDLVMEGEIVWPVAERQYPYN